MKYKKIILALIFISVIGFSFNFNASKVEAIAIADIQNLIRQLQSLILNLQQQLQQLQRAPQAPQVPQVPQVPFITITSPTEGQQIQSGTTHIIRWDSGRIEARQNIHVLQRITGGIWTSLAVLNHNVNSYNWVVPSVDRETNVVIWVGVWENNRWIISDSATALIGRGPIVVDRVRVPVINPDGAPYLPIGSDYHTDPRVREDFRTGRRVGCGDSIAFIEKRIEPTTRPLEAIYRLLFSREEITIGTKYVNSLLPHTREGRTLQTPDGPQIVRPLRFERVIIENNIAKVYLVGDFISVGTCDPPRVKAVLEFAAKQYPWIEEVEIYINGERAVFVHGGR